MSKRSFFVFIVMLFCGSTFAQSTTWTNDTAFRHDIPVGVCEWDDLASSDYFAAELKGFYDTYTPERMAVADIARACKGTFPGYSLHATFYFAAWSNDCHELLPAFIRWTEELGHNYSFPVHYTLVAVDRNLLSHNDLHDARRISAVPTAVLSMRSNKNPDDIIELGSFSGLPKEQNLETELYMIFARYMKYQYR